MRACDCTGALRRIAAQPKLQAMRWRELAARTSAPSLLQLGIVCEPFLALDSLTKKWTAGRATRNLKSVQHSSPDKGCPVKGVRLCNRSGILKLQKLHRRHHESESCSVRVQPLHVPSTSTSRGRGSSPRQLKLSNSWNAAY